MRQGYSLLGILLGLAIITLALVMSFQMYNRAMEVEETNAYVDEMALIRGIIQDITKSGGNIANIDTAIMSTSPEVPSKYKASNGLLLSPWSGYIVMYGYHWGDVSVMELEMTATPKGICERISTMDFGQYESGINGNNWMPDTLIKPADIAGMCGDGNDNDVAFYFTN